MNSVSKKNRDKAMKYIVDYYNSHNCNSFIVPKSLIDSKTFPQNTDYKKIISVLVAMGYISCEKTTNKIILEAKGKCYFENQSDENSRIHKEHIHNWQIAIFSAFCGAFLSEPLWDFLHWIVRVLRSR